MKKYTNNSFALVVLAAFLFSIIPSLASAATVYTESSRNTLSVGDTAIITVKINAEGTVLNTVEGDIVLRSNSGDVAVQEFSLANSSFGLWPRTPSLSTDGNTITFVGGVPGGFSIEGATLFKIIVEATKEGLITIAPANISVFANDGKGTKMTAKIRPITLTVTAAQPGVSAVNEWDGVVASDSRPPEDFIIVLGQDSTLFDGKNFAFFSALDNQSGIDYYEVSEDGKPAVRSGSTYVLRNQGDDVKLKVVAYDKAGNKKTASYPASRPISWLSIFVVVLVAVVLKVVYKKWRKRKANTQTDAFTSHE